MSRYEIRLYYMGYVYKTLRPQSKKEAKKKYYISANSEGQYTQLVVDGRPLTTAQAERFLGPEGPRPTGDYGNRPGKRRKETGR